MSPAYPAPTTHLLATACTPTLEHEAVEHLLLMSCLKSNDRLIGKEEKDGQVFFLILLARFSSEGQMPIIHTLAHAVVPNLLSYAMVRIELLYKFTLSKPLTQEEKESFPMCPCGFGFCFRGYKHPEVVYVAYRHPVSLDKEQSIWLMQRSAIATIIKRES